MEMQGLIRELLGRVHVVCVIVITFTVFVGKVCSCLYLM